MTIEAFAPAKVNLTLHVTGLRGDGYHLLDSLVAFADVGDRLSLKAAPGMSMEVSGPFADGVPCDGRNLAWRAAEHAGWSGHITLVKNLPHGAGIGGGSSDAGAVLRALQSPVAAAGLGADVAACRLAEALRMSGIGEDITPVRDMPAFPAVLVNPGAHLATPRVFAALRDKAQPPMGAPPSADTAPETWIAWLAAQRNDLEDPATRLAPVIADVRAALERTEGALLTRMSGSGATCFALYREMPAAQAAAETLADACPDWWVVATTLS